MSDPDGGTVNVKFHLWPTGHHPNDDPDGVLIVNQSVAVTSGAFAKLKVAKSARAGSGPTVAERAATHVVERPARHGAGQGVRGRVEHATAPAAVRGPGAAGEPSRGAA